MTARSVAAAAVAATVAAALPTAPAAGATCADRVLADWSDGRITGTYAPACYRMAIAGLPDDLDAYTTAREDIERALRERLRELEAAPTTRPEAPARALAGARPATTQARPPAATTPAPTTAVEPATTPSEAVPAAPAERGGSRWRQLLPVLVVGLLLALGVPALLRR